MKKLLLLLSLILSGCHTCPNKGVVVHKYTGKIEQCRAVYNANGEYCEMRYFPVDVQYLLIENKSGTFMILINKEEFDKINIGDKWTRRIENE